jgi:phosphoglucosamine mutase
VVCRRFTPLPQLLKNVRYRGQSPLHHPAVIAAKARAEDRLAGNGRLLLRPSGTEPLIRVMAEGEDKALVHEVVDALCMVIEQAALEPAS